MARKCLEGAVFGRYVAALRQALVTAIDPAEIGVLHLQHLTFGATPALIWALPAHPRLALVRYSPAHVVTGKDLNSQVRKVAGQVLGNLEKGRA